MHDDTPPPGGDAPERPSDAPSGPTPEGGPRDHRPSLSSDREREEALAEVLRAAEAEEKAGPEKPPAPPLSSERQREVMLDEVVRAAEVKEAVRRPWKGGRTTTPLRLVLSLVLTGVAIWLWFFPPGILAPPAPPTPSAVQVEAALRFAVALQAERIHAHRVEARRLPDFLREVGDTLPGMRYRRLDGGTFLLVGSAGEVEVSYRSDQSLEEFLGDAVRRLGESQ